MGSLSPVIADIVMQELENTVLDSITFSILFYYRHVDDIVIAVPSNITDLILNNFNAFHLRLQFTIELEGQVNFLDHRNHFRR